MASVEKFEDLEVWQRARKLANEIYAISSSGAFARDFVLRDQIRGAAVSAVSNIAEGFERGGNQEFLQFLSIAKGSAGEVRSQLYLALDQNYVDRSTFDRVRDLAFEVSGKLGGLIAYLKASGMKGSKYRADEPEISNLKPGVFNPEPGTLNPEPGTLNQEPGTRNREAGFSIVTAIFLVVVLAMLGVFIVSMTGLQQSSTQLDVQGVRAYHAARAGVEWAAFRILTPVAAIPPACPAASTDIAGLGGSLSAFTVTVTCTETSTTTEGNRNVRSYRIVSIACNEPVGPSCLVAGNPVPGPSPRYVERQLEVVLSRCNDLNNPPRFACGL